MKFIGKFDVPIMEPTPKELAEQEKLRKKREKQREYSKRSREKKSRQRPRVEYVAPGAVCVKQTALFAF